MNTTVHQQQVAPGGIIRANKTWKNIGAAGYRDILAIYGTGLTLEAFVMEFGAIATGQYCAAGAQVTTPVDCTVPVGASPGLRNALVGVGKYDPSTSVITLDDYDIVVDAIDVTVAPPPEGVALVAGWNNVVYMGLSQAIESAVASIMPYLVQISVYRQGVYYDYYPADPMGSTLTDIYYGEACWVKVTQDCFWSW